MCKHLASLQGFGVIGGGYHMAKEPRIIRMPSKEEGDSLAEEYALAVGRLALSWNAFQETLSTIFVRLLQTHELFAIGVWYSTDNDRAQRAMLKALLPLSAQAWRQYPKAADDIAWLIEEANSLANLRNAAIHAPVLLMIGGGSEGSHIMTPSPFSDHPRAKQLRKKGNLLEEFAWYERWADTLTIFGRQMENVLFSKTYSWPDRPQRPERARKKSRPDQPHQARAK
jgi:hypothetical protein